MFNSFANKFNLKRKTVQINGRKDSFDILINTIAPDEIFNFKYGKLGFIGRDFQVFHQKVFLNIFLILSK